MAKKKKRHSQKKKAVRWFVLPSKKNFPKIKEPISLKLKLLIGVLLAALAMILYAPSHNYDFVYDDEAVISDNQFVHKGLNGLKDIWTTSYFRGYNAHMNVNAFRPIPLTTFALEYEFGQLDSGIYHKTQIILYGLTAFFLFLFLSTLLWQFHPLLPFAACVLFIVHPVHVEVVANIKSRDELIAFLSFSIASWLLLRYVDTQKILALLGALLFYTISLFSKESAITTLAIIPAMLYFFRNVNWKKIILLLIPFAILALIFVIYRYNVVGTDYIKTKYFDNSLLAASGISERISSNIMVLGFYLFKAIFPHPLVSDYSYNTLPNVGWDSYKVWLSLMAYVVLLWFLIKGFFKRKVHAFAIYYYFVTVSIFSSVLFPGFSVYNDRFLYHPVLGICLLVTGGIYQVVKTEMNGMKIKGTISFFRANLLPLGLIIAITGLGIYKTETRLPDWKNRYVLFEKDVKKTPTNARMRKNYGGSLSRQAIDLLNKDPNLSEQYARQAITELEGALAIYDTQATAYIHKGNMHAILREPIEAEQAYKKGLTIDPTNHNAKTNLAIFYYQTQRYKESIEIINSIPENQLTQDDYYVLSLVWSHYGDNEKAKYYLNLSGR